MDDSNDDERGLTVGEFLRMVKSEQAAQFTVGQFVAQIKKDSPKKPLTNNPACVMCEFAMSALEKQLINNHTEVSHFTHLDVSVH